MIIVNESEKPKTKTQADSLFHCFKSNLQVCLSMPFQPIRAKSKPRGT